MQYFIPVALVVGIGALAGVILTIAAKFMAVKVDETAVSIAKALPGANCGACGYAGCADVPAGTLGGDMNCGAPMQNTANDQHNRPRD